MYVEENTCHIPEIPETIVTEIKKQLWEALKEFKLEIVSQVKEEMIKVMKEMLKN